MNWIYNIIIILIISPLSLLGQEDFQGFLKKADQYYDEKNYEQSFNYYKKAIKTGKATYRNLYNAACAASLAGETKCAGKWLKKSIKGGWTDVDWMKQDTDFDNLRKKEGKWNKIVATAEKGLKAFEATLNMPLRKELLAMRKEDQHYRRAWIEAMQKHGNQHETTIAYRDTVLDLDEKNTSRMMELVESNGGWPKISEVGPDGASAAWLLAQHADQKPDFQKQALDLMQPLLETKEVSPKNYAYLYDRVALANFKKQRYGSQMIGHYNKEGKLEYQFQPIEEEWNLDKRRAEIGLGSAAEYAGRSGFNYVLPTEAEAKKREADELAEYHMMKDSAHLYHQLGDYKSARKAFRKVTNKIGLVTGDDYFEAARVVGMVEDGKKSTILYYLENALQLGFNDEERLLKQEEFFHLHEEEGWGRLLMKF